MSYPATLDAFDDKADGVDYPQAADINVLNNALENVEAKLGVDDSNVVTTIDYFLKHASGAYRTHIHDGGDDDGAEIPMSSLAETAYYAGGIDVAIADGGTGAGTAATAFAALKQAASTTATGVVELATTAETTTGTDTGRVVTPDGLHDMTSLSGAAWMLDEDAMGSNSNTKVATQQSIKKYVDDSTGTASSAYPVGSIYMNASVATNPATLLGFGTWSAFGAGRVLIGLDAGDADFDTAEETGGAKTHTLTEAEMPSHSHTGTTGNQSASHTHSGTTATQSADHSHGASLRFVGSGGDVDVAGAGSNTLQYTDDNYTSHTHTVTTGNQSASHTHTINTATAGSGDAHSIVQPYIVCYMWKRTA